MLEGDRERGHASESLLVLKLKTKAAVKSVFQGVRATSALLERSAVFSRHCPTISFGLHFLLVIVASCFILHEHHLFWLMRLDHGQDMGNPKSVAEVDLAGGVWKAEEGLERH